MARTRIPQTATESSEGLIEKLAHGGPDQLFGEDHDCSRMDDVSLVSDLSLFLLSRGPHARRAMRHGVRQLMMKLH